MKKGAIFDMDGLLFDTERMYRDFWIELAIAFGQEPDPTFPPAVCGTSGAHSLEVIRAHYPAIDAEAYLAACIARMEERVRSGVPVKPGAEELLAFFRQNGVKIAIASSSVRGLVERNLELTGLRGYFDAVVSGDDVAHGKPKPDIFLYAAAQLGLPAADCYVLEDGINGARAGLAAGCVTVMVPDLTPPTEDLKQGCAAILESLSVVQEWLAQGRL